MTSREVSHTECSTSWQCEKETLATRSHPHRRQRSNRGRNFILRWQRRATHSPHSRFRKRLCTAAATNGSGSPSSSTTESSHSLCTVYGGTAVTICTDFVAETMLPTSSGQFRLRGYRHTLHLVSLRCLHLLLSRHRGHMASSELGL